MYVPNLPKKNFKFRKMSVILPKFKRTTRQKNVYSEKYAYCEKFANPPVDKRESLAKRIPRAYYIINVDNAIMRQ